MPEDRYLSVTIDTESDWLDKAANTLENLKSLETLTKLFDRYGIIPTYLITYEVAVHKEYAAMLKQLQNSGLCEIGTHLHVWSTPPFANDNGNGVDEGLIDGIQSELSDEEFYSKMETLHRTVTEVFGKAPTSHRAGRWAIDMRTIKWLSDNGYICDTSVCPRTDWTGAKGVRENIKTNTFNAPETPYLPNVSDLTKAEGDRVNLAEMPVTFIKASSVFGSYSTKLSKNINGLFRNMGARVHKEMLLRPSYYMPANTFAKVCRHLFSDGQRFYTMMFHSSECWPGTSPQSKTDKRHKMLMHRLEAGLKEAQEAGLKGIGVTQAAQEFMRTEQEAG